MVAKKNKKYCFISLVKRHLIRTNFFVTGQIYMDWLGQKLR